MVSALITDSLPQVLVIVGATATGKSETAQKVAERIDGEIVSADARQIYSGLTIGSGAPPTDWMEKIPYHFVGTEGLDKRVTAGDFSRMAQLIVREIVDRGRIPIVVGGSGLYIRALIDGLAPVPPGSATIRLELWSSLGQGRYEDLFRELKEADPEYAAIVSETTPKRLIRALEVKRHTGVAFSKWHREHQPEPWCKPLKIGLERPRPELREIIALRTKSMIESGWLSEVKGLTHSGNSLASLPVAAREAVGYQLLSEVISGNRTIEEAVELIVFATRQYAKRQMTWFRADQEIQWLSGSGEGAVAQWVEEIISHWESFVNSDNSV